MSVVTKYDFYLNSRWWAAAILKVVFGHNSAADCPISVKQHFGNGTYCCTTQNVFFVLLMQFGLRRVAPFIFMSDTLVKISTQNMCLQILQNYGIKSWGFLPTD